MDCFSCFLPNLAACNFPLVLGILSVILLQVCLGRVSELPLHAIRCINLARPLGFLTGRNPSRLKSDAPDVEMQCDSLNFRTPGASNGFIHGFKVEVARNGFRPQYHLTS